MPSATVNQNNAAHLVGWALTANNYCYDTKVTIGKRMNDAPHVVDFYLRNNIAVVVRWQQTSGTAEQKIPYEAMCLYTQVKAMRIRKAYLVLGGDGWTLRDYYIRDLANDLNIAGVIVCSLDSFISRLNKGIDRI